jgi:hypothetical protein
MRLRRPRPRRPRVLDAPEVLRILSRGGILFERNGLWSVYRTNDARGLRVGIVEDALPGRLVADGLARHVAGVRGGSPRLAGSLLDARR